ncbi:unnamed protein product, partial [Polarella glacialis]
MPRILDEGLAGTLEIWLPDGRLLLRHTLEPVRWLPASSRSPQRGPAECAAVHGTFDAETARCSEQHILARLCYAVQPDGGPWDGKLVSDCEYGHRSPVYVPLADHLARGDMEVILRGRMDPYVYASEVT